MMVVYHLGYDLDTFGGYGIDSTTGAFAFFADLTASFFLFLVGVSLTIGYSRRGGSAGFGKYLRRGLIVFGYGMLLTVGTWIAGVGVIWFGILHLIGVSIILAYPLLRYRWASLALGILVIVVGEYMRSQGVSSETPWLLPFGVIPENLFMPDYRPLLPWFGVVLLGVAFGNAVYGREKRPVEVRSTPAAARPLGFLGRHSLLIYLIHQPIMVAILAALGIIELGIF